MRKLKTFWRYEFLKPYLVSTLVVGCAFLLKFATPHQILAEIPFLIFFSAVVISGIYGGFAVGMYATLLSALLADYFFLPPTMTFIKDNWHQDFKIFLYIVDCAAVAALCGKLKSALLQARSEKDEREKSVRALEEKTAFLKTMIEQIPMAVVFADAKTGELIFANSQLEKIWRHKFIRSKDIEGYHEYIGFHPDGRRFEGHDWPLAKAITENRLVSEECDVLLGDGVRAVLRIIAAPVHNAAGEVIAGVVISEDVTDRKKNEIQLKSAKEEAERANQAKTQFLANMSHEIRTPIGAIMGFSNLLNSPGITEEDRTKFIQIIERNSNQLLKLIDDILDLSKVEAGKLAIEKIKFLFTDFLSEFANLMTLKAREKGILFQMSLESLVPDYLCTDPTRLRQILVNLVGNAIKFTHQGKVSLRVRSSPGNILEFEIEDTGIGISSDKRERLFQPFAQADVSMTRKYGGTGLGLVLCKRLSEALGGDVSIAWSDPGKGSRFILHIPYTPVDKAQLIGPDRIVIANGNVINGFNAKAPLAGMKILLADDLEDNQMLIRVYLGKSGAEVMTVNNGREAVQAAQEKNPDVVLMDIQMPVMDGHEAIRQLRSIGFSKPIIALTAHAMAEERDRCFESGCTDYLTKPISKEILLDVLSRYQNKVRA